MSTAQLIIPKGEHNEILRNADRLWHIQKTSLAQGLSLRELHLLAASFTDRIYDKGEVIFRQEEAARAIYFVNRGSVRLSVANLQGRERIMAVLGTGEVFGEEVLGAKRKRRTQAIAHEEAWISLATMEITLRLMNEIPALNRNLIRLLVHKLAEAREELEILSFSDTEHRIASTLLKLSAGHGMKVASSEFLRKLRIPVSHEYLAQMIGANRPHVSAIMSQFKKRGWIQYQKRKLLINTAELSNLVSRAESH